MRDIILDTQILLWYQADSPLLSSTSLAALLDEDNALFISQTSWWEMAIKISGGKLAMFLAESMLYANRRGINTLDIASTHLLYVEALPFYIVSGKEHRDPFDRLIISQALVENMSVLSADEKFDWYPGLHRIT